MLEQTPHNYFLEFTSSYDNIRVILEEYGYTKSKFDADDSVFFEKDGTLIPVYNSDTIYYTYLLILSENAKISKHDFIASLSVLNKK